MSFPNFIALIPAAGAGTRMGEATPKQYLTIAGKTMLQHVVDTFCAAALIDRVVVVVSAVALVLTIDRTFNAIWRVRQPRPLAQRLLIYWAAITIGPLLLAGSLAALMRR